MLTKIRKKSADQQPNSNIVLLSRITPQSTPLSAALLNSNFVFRQMRLTSLLSDREAVQRQFA